MKSTLAFRDTRVTIVAEGGRVFLGVVHPCGVVLPELGIDQATLLAGELERAVHAAQRQARNQSYVDKYHAKQEQRA